MLISLLLFHMARSHDVWLSWGRWLRFGLWPVFNDLWLTLQHLRDTEMGLDPLSDPAADFAYPKALLALRHLGLQHLSSAWLGLLQGILMTTAVLAVLRPFTPLRAIGASLGLMTPAMLLGFERGNVDFFFFVLCSMAALLWARFNDRLGLIAALFLLMIGAILKLYPMFALLVGVVTEAGKRRLYWLGAIFIIASYWFTVRAEFSLLAGKIPIMTQASWGALVSFGGWGDYLRESHPASWLESLDWMGVGLCTYGSAALVAAWLGRRMANGFGALDYDNQDWCCFWLGSGICCGCFTAANFAYRWAFALFAIPLLVRGLRSADRAVVLWARVTIGALALSMGAKLSLSAGAFLLVQLANWIFVLGLIVGCAALLPTVIGGKRQPATSTKRRELRPVAREALND